MAGSKRLGWWFAGALVLTASAACGSSGNQAASSGIGTNNAGGPGGAGGGSTSGHAGQGGTTTATTGGHAGHGGHSTTGTTSTTTGGHGGQGGAGGSGGSAGAAPLHSATETVNAGQLAKSPSYTMQFTLGQPTQMQGTLQSPNYRMQGGLIGANGSLP